MTVKEAQDFLVEHGTLTFQRDPSTGRISCLEPNLVNTPHTEKVGKRRLVFHCAGGAGVFEPISEEKPDV